MKSLLTFGFTVVISGLFPSTARAEGSWGDSFPAEALATYLDSADASILVAGAGDDVKPATKAFVAALRGTGKTRLVTDDKALGDLAEASDADVLKKAAKSPVDLVAVVRVFPAGGGKPPTAVVTFFSKKSGDVLSALSVTKGTPVTARTSTGAVPSAAMTSVGEVIGKDQGGVEGGLGLSGTDGNKILEEKGVWSQNMLVINARNGVALGEYTNFFKGKFGPPLNGGDLFRYVGRKDLGAEYDTRMAIKMSLLWGGFAGAVLVGPGIMLWGLLAPPPCQIEDQFGICSQQPISPAVWVGVAITAIGLVAIFPGAFMSPTSLSANEVAGLVEKFNEKLEKGETQPNASNDPPKIAWNIGSFSTPGGAGLSFDLKF